MEKTLETSLSEKKTKKEQRKDIKLIYDIQT